MRKAAWFVGGLLCSSLILAGCSGPGPGNRPGRPVTRISASRPGEVAGLGIESQDLQEVADKMLRSILDTPVIAGAEKPPRVVLLPVENNTRFPINKDIFLSLIKARLNSEAKGKVRFLARDEMEAIKKERELKRSGEYDYDPTKEAAKLLGGDYFLTGKLEGMSQRGAEGGSDYVLYTFRLIDAETTEEVWEDYAQIKKEGLDDVVYR
jgi:PBP1b-binding outer membrane lipoprotein LpoB